MVFRDGDHVGAAQFGQHVAVAEDILDTIETIPQRIASADEGVSQEVMDVWAREMAMGWENVWTQLQEARAIVVARGREVGAFDAARTRAGDIWNDVAVGKSVTVGNEVHMKWRSVPTSTAREAIAALRAAMPEVVVMKQAPIDVDLRGTGSKVLDAAYVVGGIAVALAIVYFIYRAVTS